LDRVFIDANVLFSATYRSDSGLKKICVLAREGGAQLVTSAYAVEEARRNLKGAAMLVALEKLLRRVEVIAPDSSGTAMPPTAEVNSGKTAPSSLAAVTAGLPAKDIPILLAAISARATHLITGDQAHFGFMYGKTIEGVLVETPGNYLGSRGRKSNRER